MGAGFCLDANRCSHVSDLPGTGYPLAKHLAGGFDNTYDLSHGIEQAFADARTRGDHRPVDALVDRIQQADYFLGGRIAELSESPYRRLIEAFPGAQFVSFNYDSLLELVLLRLGLWTPLDGFGVPAKASMDAIAAKNLPFASASEVRVFHLHGSIYLYAAEAETYSVPGDRTIWFQERATPEFRFDPDALSSLFLPFERSSQDLHFMLPGERVIIPVPDKSVDLAQRYVRIVYEAACDAVRQSSNVIAIGYSFSPHDRSSYIPLLDAIKEKAQPSITLVDPESESLAERLRIEHPKMTIKPIPTSFADWMESVSGKPK